MGKILIQMTANFFLTDLSRPALAAAGKANLYELFRSFRHSALAEFENFAGLERWYTPVPHPWFNAVLASRPPGDHEPRVIREIVASFRAPGFPGWAAGRHGQLVPGGWRGRHL